MTPLNILVFDSSGPGGNIGNWIPCHNFMPRFSLQIIGLEAGETINVYATNYNKFAEYASNPAIQDTSAGIIATYTGTGEPYILTLDVTVGWIQIVKTGGAAPSKGTTASVSSTPTYVQLAAIQHG